MRADLAENRYQIAIRNLWSTNKTDAADWNDLMGYSLRNSSRPDLLAAASHYQAALKIDPDHKRAVEYYGELKLMQGDRSGAAKLLRRLTKAGRAQGCEQYDDLAKAIADYK